MEKKKLSVIALILMVFTTVFGFNNITRSFWLMGYAAIPWYILSALLFFIPYAFINAEFGAAFKESKGGIYTWMERSVGPKFGFIGVFMWYASYVIWLVALAITIWVTFSYAVTGSDSTSQWALFLGIPSNIMLAVFGILWVGLLSWMATKGNSVIQRIASIGGTATTLLNIVLLLGALIVFISNGGKLAQPITSTSFTMSPNPNYTNIVAMVGFVVMALFAYGGIEAVAGFVDDTENPEKNFPKGLKISAIIITVGYAIGIFAVGAFTNWQSYLSDTTKITFANASYEIMKGLGLRLGEVFGMSNPEILGQIVVRYMAISLFLALSGAYLTLLSQPLKQLIAGTPKEMWPGKMGELNENDIPVNGLKVQAAIVIFFILLVSLTGGKGGKLFQNITMMMNTSMTLPYVFIAYAFWPFKNNDAIKKPFVMFKKKSTALFSVISACATVIIGNVLQIADPIANYLRTSSELEASARQIMKNDALTSAAFMIFAPVIFTIIAVIIYENGMKKIAAKGITKTSER